MRQSTPRVITILFSLAAAAQLSAAPMFEDLAFGDSKKVVEQKLFGSKRFTSPARTMLGRTGLNGFFTAKKKVSSLHFTVHFGWQQDVTPLRLESVALYSNEASSASLQQAFKELTSTLTAIYGNPKLNNGLPSTSKVPQVGMIMPGAIWMFDTHAVSLGIGHTDKGYNVIVNFTEKQPQLIRTP